eukprot:3259793-Pyramimonas_sp.AAC.1
MLSLRDQLNTWSWAFWRATEIEQGAAQFSIDTWAAEKMVREAAAAEHRGGGGWMRRQRRRGMGKMRREGKGKSEKGARRWGMGNNRMPPEKNPNQISVGAAGL